MDTIFEEFQFSGITQLSAPPRLYDLIFSQFQTALAEALRNNPERDQEVVRKEVLAETKKLLGGNLKHLIIGGAASSPKVFFSVSSCF